MSLKPQSPSQTVGPFFHNALIRAGEQTLVNANTKGERIRLTGQVFDGDGQGVPDAMLEIWQADATGHFNHPADVHCTRADPNFGGFGRAPTDENGVFLFETIKPGAILSTKQAPHINIRFFARGLLIHAVTRMYFPDASDSVLESLPANRRQTLIAKLESDATYRFDIHLQGELETVFFDV